MKIPDYIFQTPLAFLLAIALGIAVGSYFFRQRKARLDQITLEQLIQAEYVMRFPQECNYIWQNYVPEYGQSQIFQGELLRAIEKLRYEAQRNGNANWDNDFVYFCDFLQEGLCNQNIFTKDEKRIFRLIIDHFRRCGNYARKFHQGLIANEDVKVSRLAYVDNNLYDLLADTVAFLHLKLGRPVPYEPKKWLRR